MNNNILRTKAYNIKFLKKTLKNKKIIIPTFFNFTLHELKSRNLKIIKKIYNINSKKKIILRSSSVSEDGLYFTNAGKYESFILKKNSSIDKIKESLNIFKKQFNKKKDEIIVQEFIDNVDCSGVVFTKDSNTNAPYYLINFDYSGKTDFVTSGKKSDKHNQFILYKNFKKKNQFSSLIDICKYLENKVKDDRLDIEFALKNKKIYIFQIRYLPQIKIIDYKYPYQHKEILINIEKKLSKLLNKNITLQGRKNIFSNMADWNPAEMIGEKPNTLALSLYKELISDEIWRIQRKNYGYADVFPNILIFSFGGIPYVDLRTDINSFLPNSLSKKNKEVIVNKYLSILSQKSFLHDKIEFDLVETCYSINSKKRLQLIFNKKISKEYLSSLNKLTINIFQKNLLQKDIDKINEFKNKILEIKGKKENYIQKIFFINKITKQFGTLAFAGIARCAFIAQRILLDLKENKLISDEEYDNFFYSIPNITDEIKNDFEKFVNNKITKSTFLERYGHLRPQTYEINSLNYKEGFNLYFDKKLFSLNSRKTKKAIFKKKIEINHFFKRNLKITFFEFLEFSKKSIYWREKSKYYFTIGIDKIFENLINLGKSIKINRKDLSFIDIKNILNYFSKLENEKLIKSLRNEIKKNKNECNALNKVKLPEVILSKKDIFSYYESKSKINFITNKKITGSVVNLKNRHKIKSMINNKIIVLENADPGYDFIFNYNIKGLITKYGGSNSHMSIRCLENQIPACIGVGKINYELIKKNKKVYIDCNNKILKVL